MYDLTVIGNSPVDALTHVDESILTKYKLNKGDFNPVPTETFAEIAQSCTFEALESGGSTANTAWTLGVMGKYIHFIGHIGDDPAGRHFYKDMQTAEVEMRAPDKNARTMEVFVLITPDGERTFISRGVTAPLRHEMIDEDIIKNSNWLLVEGYALLDQSDAVKKSIQWALKHDTKIAFTVSAAFAIQIAFNTMAEDVIPYTDLLIANDEEMDTLIDAANKMEKGTQKTNLLETLSKMAKIITHSEKGATFSQGGQKQFMPTDAIDDVLDATGAGDAFVAGFLYGYIENDVQKGLRIGHKLGGKIIQQLGGRIKDKTFIKESINN
ncbi:MAG: sugar/nucleoside kinase (ribokinase family) [Alphaproteobacteria bacterium]|jgi:sugar/nucleoside kinase (ribokinase family)